MKHGRKYVLLSAVLCFLLHPFPSFADEWQENEDGKWQYVMDGGELATGWLELDEGVYYLDSRGNRKEDYWLKDDGDWFYFDEDGLLLTDTWVDNYHVDKEGRMDKKR